MPERVEAKVGHFKDAADIRVFALIQEKVSGGRVLVASIFSLKKTHVDIFVASHHGRELGYCAEVFDYCKPSLVVIPDGTVDYDAEKMASIYAEHASGRWLNGTDGREWRKVVTTRNDGPMRGTY